MYFPDLIVEYKQLLQDMKLEGVTNSSMYQEVKQAIEWMETGYDPAEHRAVTRTDVFSMDPYHMQTFMAYVNDDLLMPEHLLLEKELVKEGKMLEDTHVREMERLENVKAEVNDAMAGLTEDERAVFIAIKGECMPFSKVAKMMGVTKSTVQSYLSRAQRKISFNINNGSQLVLFEVG